MFICGLFKVLIKSHFPDLRRYDLEEHRHKAESDVPYKAESDVPCCQCEGYRSLLDSPIEGCGL